MTEWAHDGDFERNTMEAGDGFSPLVKCLQVYFQASIKSVDDVKKAGEAVQPNEKPLNIVSSAYRNLEMMWFHFESPLTLKKIFRPGAMAHACNSSTLGGQSKWIT